MECVEGNKFFEEAQAYIDVIRNERFQSCKDRTGKPSIIYMLHHIPADESVGADTPLVDGAVIALIDVREI